MDRIVDSTVQAGPIKEPPEELGGEEKQVNDDSDDDEGLGEDIGTLGYARL